MLIIPAIDIFYGNCVRLVKGEFGTAKRVASDALKTALDFQEQGAEYLHMVDLNGALVGDKTNHELFCKIAAEIKIPVELGGGIRSIETIDYYIEHGISRIILGTAAISNKGLVKEAVNRYGEKIAVGIDAKRGLVCTDGWTMTSETNYIDFAKSMEDIGVKFIIFTDISRDGTLTGPNLEQLSALATNVSCNIIASGGIRDLENIKALKTIKLYGAICGKSLYSGTLSLAEAIRVTENAV